MVRYLFRRLFYFSLFFLLVFMIMISNTFFVEASIGFTSFYSENFPLRLQPGDVEDIFFILHNVPPGEGDIDIEIELTSGEEIAALTEGMMYHVPFGQEVKVPARIEIPRRAKAGTEYIVSVLVKPSSIQGGGNIGLTTNIRSSFPVIVERDGEEIKEEVVEESPPVGNIGNILFWVIFGFLAGLIIVVFLLIIYFVRRQRIAQISQVYGLNENVVTSKF